MILPSSVPSESTIWAPGRHVSQLDGVRGLAILVVTIYRFGKHFPEDHWLGKLVHAAVQFGDTGVELFFVLSGFLITGILIDAKGTSHFFRNFFARRSLRIFPLYFGALFLLLVLFPSVGIAPSAFQPAIDQQFYLWTYLTNVQMSIQQEWCFGPLDHFWSLAVEEHFYLLWPIVIFFFSPQVSLRLAWVLTALIGMGRVGFCIVSSNAVAPDVLSIFRFDSLLMGAILALQIRQPGGLEPLRRWLWIGFPALFLFAAVLFLKGGRLATIPLTVIPLLWTCMMIWLLTSSPRSRFANIFDWKFLRLLGKYSYAMYVFQSPLIPLTASVFSMAGLASFFELVPGLNWLVSTQVLGGLAYIGIMFLLTYGAAVLSWYTIEKHFLKLKDRFASSSV